MHQNRRWLKDLYLKKAIPKEDDEGTIYTDYDDTPVDFKANVQPAGGKVMAEMYGERLAYMLTMYYSGSLDIKEKDGICVYAGPSEKPDYKIVAIRPWNNHKVIDLEKVM